MAPCARGSRRPGCWWSHFLGGGRMGGGSLGGSDAARQISAWVQQSFTASSVGGAAAHDLTDTSAAGLGPVV